jgi:Polysaccharide lyase
MKTNSLAKLFVTLLLLATASSICRATVFFENTGTTNGWTTLWHEKGNLLQTNSPTYRGPTAVRCETTYDPKYEGRYHTELRKGGMAALGMDRYYGFAFYLPANWEFDNQSYNIQQFIASVNGCSGGQPATMTHLYGRSLITRTVTGPDGCTRTTHSLTVVTNVTPGVWHTVVIHGNWSATNTGVFEFWYDGVRKISQSGSPNIPNDDTVFNLAVGNYSNGWHDDGTNVGTQNIRDIYVDHIRVTDDYAEADPAAWLGPADGGQFAMSADSSADSLTPGSNVVYNIQIVPFNGFNSNVTFSVRSLPPNVTASFNPTTVGPTNSSVLTLTAAVNAVPGDYTFMLIGTSGGLGVTNAISLTVDELAPTADTFFAAADNAYALRSGATTVEDSSQSLQVKRLNDSNTRVSYIRFNLGSFLNTHSATGLSQAQLHLYIPNATSGGGTLNVYGLLDNIGGTNGFDGNWNSSSLTWNNQPAKTASPNDISSSSSSLPNTNTTTSLAGAGIPSTAGAFDVPLNIANLTNLLIADSNQQITLMLVNNSSTIVSFASLANTGNYPQPTLELVNPVTDFSISLLPSQTNVMTGSNVSFTVTIATTNGFTGNVALSADDLPSGISANFNPPTISGTGSATLTLSAASDMPPDNYSISITGAGDSASHSGNVLLTVKQLDSDGDGIPDAWMMQYFGHPTGLSADKSRADDDADGDGVPNWAEYAAGTDPTDGASYLHLVNTQPQGNDQAVSWSAIGGVSYVVQASTNLSAGFFDISPVIAPDQDGTNTFMDTGAATNSVPRFYRIRLAP